MAEQDAYAAQVDEAGVVLDLDLPASDDSSEVVEPSRQPLHLAVAAVSPKRSAVLRLPAVAPVRGDHLDAYAAELLVQAVAVVDFIPDQSLRESIDKAPLEYRANKSDFRWRSRINVDGERKTSAVCHCHDLAALAPASGANTGSPFFAETKVASTKHSLRSRPPRAPRSSANLLRIYSKTPASIHCRKRRWQVDFVP